MKNEQKQESAHQDENKKRIATAEVRSQIYYLLSLAFLYPRKELYALLSDGFMDKLKPAASYLYANYCKEDDPEIDKVVDILEALDREIEKLHDKPITELQGHYTKVFGHTISQECPQYETQYGIKPDQVYQKTNEMGDIAGFYRAFGLEVTEDENTRDRVDHIGMEFEFMHFLACKEAYGIGKKDSEDKIKIVTDAQKKFMKEHIGMWVPLFAKYLERKTKNGGFYKEIARFTAVFVEREIDYLKVKPRRLKSEEVAIEPMEDELIKCDVADPALAEKYVKPNLTQH